MRALLVVGFCISTLLYGCAIDPVEAEYGERGVQPEEITAIKVSIRKITRSPIMSCTREFKPKVRGEIIVTTRDYKSYSATKSRGKWFFREVVFL